MQAINRWPALVALCAAMTWTTTAAAQAAKTSPQTPDTARSTSADTTKLLDRQVWLGTVRLPVRVMADGKPLPAGTYRVRLTGEHAKDNAVGQSDELERWVEFVQGNQVKGRAMAPVVPAQDAKQVAESALPGRGTVRVQRLKGDQYYRLWFNHQGDQVLIYLPIG